MRQLHPTNCLGIRNFADTHACKELHKRSHKFALQNFQEVMGTEEFLLLPFQEVDELIASSQLNVDKEEKVFEATIAWVRHEYPERRKYVYKLLRHVHLPLISRDFLMTTVDSEPLVRENPDCKELMLEASESESGKIMKTFGKNVLKEKRPSFPIELTRLSRLTGRIGLIEVPERYASAS